MLHAGQHGIPVMDGVLLPCTMLPTRPSVQGMLGEDVAPGVADTLQRRSRRLLGAAVHMRGEQHA